MDDKNAINIPGKLKRPDWLEEVEAKLGRPVRILNLGNIANNAYQNTKIMRRAGIEADCVAYDYYHVMGTAEWEDADFDGNIGDAYFPDWWRVRFKNYQRPKWFIQGPKSLCIEYIRAKYGSDKNVEKEALYKLIYAAQKYNFKNSSYYSLGGNPLVWPSRLVRRIAFWRYAIKTYLMHPYVFRDWLVQKTKIYRNIIKAVSTIFLLPLILIGLFLINLWDRIKLIFVQYSSKQRLDYIELRRIKRRVLYQKIRARAYPVVYSFAGIGARLFRKVTGKRFGEVFGNKNADRIAGFLGIRDNIDAEITGGLSIEEIQKRRASRIERRKMKRFGNKENLNDSKLVASENQSGEDRRKKQALYNALMSFYDLAYPDHPWILEHFSRYPDVPREELLNDIVVARALSKEWEGVFELYDIVVAYSTDGILPMTISNIDYFAYEHGTLRSIPFENNTIGRLCASSYLFCQQLMITNIDNIDKPKKLGMKPSQIVYLPHAVDDMKLLGFRYEHINIKPINHERPMFLCPARHDWGDDDPSLMKGNDKLLKAVKIVADKGYTPDIVLFDWGRHVDDSKKLIKELGISHLIQWKKPMKKVDLWKSYFRCHSVVDQFSLPAFGGITFEALTFSKRIITYIDKNQSKTFFGEAPPVLNSSTPDEIADAMQVILDDPEDKAGLGESCGEWARKYHSSQHILDKQLSVFKKVILAKANK